MKLSWLKPGAFTDYGNWDLVSHNSRILENYDCPCECISTAFPRATRATFASALTTFIHKLQLGFKTLWQENFFF